MNNEIDLKKYVAPDNVFSLSIEEQCEQYGPAFRRQLDNIRHVYQSYTPKNIIFLGSGVLCDIPLEEIMAGSSDVTFVDWMPNVSADAYAKVVERWREKGFETDNQPSFLEADVTLGRSASFINGFEMIIQESTDPVACCKQCVALTDKIIQYSKPIEIPDNSMDLVVSSMVASQFAAYPYSYFYQNAVEKFPSLTPDQGQQVFPLLAQLQTNLFNLQIDGHIRELYRLVNKDGGKVYFSMEFFHNKPENSGLFNLFSPGLQALSRLNQNFYFQLQEMPAEGLFSKSDFPENSAFVHAFVLCPR